MRIKIEMIPEDIIVSNEMIEAGRQYMIRQEFDYILSNEALTDLFRVMFCKLPVVVIDKN